MEAPEKSTVPIAHLAGFVPPKVTLRLGRVGRVVSVPCVRTHPGAALFADISGFSALARELAEQGTPGVEALTGILNRFYTALVDEISGHGGEVVKFAGDGLLGLWFAEDFGPMGATSQASAAAVASRVAFTSMAAQESLALDIRIGVGTGAITTARVGGVRDRWELAAVGPAVAQCVEASTRARPGDIVLSEEAWSVPDGHWRGQRVDDDAPFWRLDASSVPRNPPPPAVAPFADSWAATLESHVPIASRRFLTPELTAWSAELRSLSVAFIQLVDRAGIADLAPAWLHSAVQIVQDHLYAYGGTLDKLSIDDKGVTALAAFGHPPQSQERACERAAEAVQLIGDALSGLGATPRVGVATGRVFCGPVGCDTRREFTVIGPRVNLAARLMQQARDEPLFDSRTQQEAVGEIAFEALAPVSVRGFDAPVTPHRAVYRRTVTRKTARIVGRDAELKWLESRIEALRHGVGSVVLIEGAAGIGKSTLVAACARRAARADVLALVGRGDPVGGAAPYHVWGPVLMRLLDIAHVQDPKERGLLLLAAMERHPRLSARTALLAPVIGAQVPESPETSQLRGAVRAQNTERLVVELLDAIGEARPLLVTIDDAHWADSASWSLIARVAAKVRSIFLVVATRPPTDPAPEGYGILQRLSWTIRRNLGGLDRLAVRLLLAQTFADADVPPPIVDWALEAGGGNPLYVRELGRALRDRYATVGPSGGPALGAEAGVDVPPSLEAVVTTRIDQLDIEHQLVLKAASVLGPVFTRRGLSRVFPIESMEPQLPRMLEQLVDAELIERREDAEREEYAFHHAITRSVAYDKLLRSQSAPMHRAAAEWLENREDDTPVLPAVLAYHWEHGEDFDRACDWLQRAGETAFESGAFPEVLRCFGRCLAFSTDEQAAVPAARRGRWRRYLAEAHFFLGNLHVSAEHAAEALRLTGRGFPTSSPGLAWMLVGQLLRQLGHLAVPGTLRARTEEARARCLERSAATQIICQDSYFQRAQLPMIASGLSTLDLAERAGPSAQLARARAAAGLITGISGLRRLSGLYHRRAVEAARSAGDIGAEGFALFARSLELVGHAEFDASEALATRGLELGASIDDRPLQRFSATVRAMASFLRGHLHEGEARFQRVLDRAHEDRHPQHEAWGLYGTAECILPLGRPDEALRLVERALEVLAEHPEEPSEVICYGLLARANAALGRQEAALEAAHQAIQRAAREAPTTPGLLEGYAGPLETLMEAWTPGEGEAAVRSALRGMRRFAKTFSVGRPRLALLEGRWLALQGRGSKAQGAWRRGIQIATALGMPLERARLHQALARALPLEHARRGEYLRLANRGLRAAGVPPQAVSAPAD